MNETSTYMYVEMKNYIITDKNLRTSTIRSNNTSL